MNTEETYQKAQPLPSRVHDHISHQGAFQRPCLAVQVEGHAAGYLPCNVRTAFVYFSHAVSQETVILEAMYLPLMSLRS